MKTQLLTTLTLSVTVVLLTLLNNDSISGIAELTVLIVLVVLIMVIGGAQRQLPEILRLICELFRRR